MNNEIVIMEVISAVALLDMLIVLGFIVAIGVTCIKTLMGGGEING